MKKLNAYNEKVCPVCGSSFSQIEKSLNFGCPECYNVFEKEISIYIAPRFEIKQDYKGSLPKHVKGYRSNLVNRMVMQLKLDEAVQNEEYEKAAFYRDYLKVLSGRKISSGEDQCADSIDGADLDKTRDSKKGENDGKNNK